MIDDINNDDFMDIIIGAAWGDRSIHALSGFTGEIIWTHDTHEYGGGGWVYQVHVKYDYNDDGIPDVLAATGNDQDYTGPQRIYCLDGLTGNSIWEFYTPGPKYSVIGIEDSNGDGIPDVVGGGSNLDETQGIVYGINGDNGNELWSFNVSGSTVWALEQTDHLNSNGVKEIIAGDFSGNYYCLDPADGSEIWNGNIGNAIILRFIKLDDVNNDNFPDLYFTHSGFNNALVVDGHSGDQIWNQPVADQPWNAARIEDISGDGINDLLVGTLYNSNYGYFLNGADGSVLGSVNVGTPVDAIASIPDIAGDGSMEMVVGGRNGWVYCYSGGNEFVNVEDIAYFQSSYYKLMQNYPNPFNPITTLRYDLPEQVNVNIIIYDMLGRQVRTLINQTQDAGFKSVIWDGTNDFGKTVSAGIYLYTIKAGDYSQTKKMVLLK
jgi:outer membrane protein assembly factor BamB